MANVLTLAVDEVMIVRNVRAKDGENYTELAQSMHDEGQLVPIQVYRNVDGDFIVKFGHQRLKIAKELGWDTIQANEVPPPASDGEALIQKAHENSARSDMSYLETAQLYQDLIDGGMRATDVAKRFGVTRATVSIAQATLVADPKIRKAVEDGRITPSGVEPIIFKDPETQAILADAVISAKTIRRVKSVVNTYERAGVIPGIDKVEETHFEEDPLLIMYREQLGDALHILHNVHPEWLESPDDFCQEDDFVAVNNQWERILEECDTSE